MTDEVSPEKRVAALEQRLLEAEAAHRDALLRVALRAEAVRAGIVDLDGLKLVDASHLSVDGSGEVAGATALMETLRRAKPWLFGASAPTGSTSSSALAPPAQAPRARRAMDMSHDEWRAARAELLRRV